MRSMAILNQKYQGCIFGPQNAGVSVRLFNTYPQILIFVQFGATRIFWCALYLKWNFFFTFVGNQDIVSFLLRKLYRNMWDKGI